MRPILRNLIFTVFTTAFVVGAPLVVLYTAGYRFNPINGRIVRTGVLVVSSLPRGATINFPGYSTNKKTPIIFNRVMPGDYQLTLSHDDYHDWQTEINVASGRSTYVNDILLFHDTPPSLLAEFTGSAAQPSPDGTSMVSLQRTESAATVWLTSVVDATPRMITQYPAKASDQLQLSWNQTGSLITLNNKTSGAEQIFDVNGTAVIDPTLTANDSPVKLVSNAQAVEVYDVRGDKNKLIALLPLAEYEIRQVTGSKIIVTSSNHSLYLLDVDAQNPILLATTGDIFDYDDSHNLLAWSDGLELHTFNLANSEQKFITRQSKAIIAVAWHNSGQALFVSTNNDLKAFTTDNNNLVTPLLADATIFSFWINEARDTGYFYGEYGGQQGLFTIPLTK